MPVLDLQQITDDAGDLSFGATVDDVKALLPHRRWTTGSKPDVDDVAGYITSVAAILDIDVGALVAEPPVLSPAAAARVVALARRAVVLGAAAQAEAAAHPERARANDASSYAEWLQERYIEAVEKAEALAAAVAEGDVPGGVELVGEEPAWSFPDPANFAARGI